MLNSVADKAEDATRKITGMIPMAVRAPLVSVVNSQIVTAILVCVISVSLIVCAVFYIVYAVKKDTKFKDRAIMAGTIFVSALAV